jgi:uncharacterized membrane protein
MVSTKDNLLMTEEELLKRQKKGARRTAAIVGFLAILIFLFTLYMSANKG